MPTTDFEGNLLFTSQDSLALSPNGHGGSLKALIDSSSILDMKERAIEHISYFQVDNPLVGIVNPLFIGLHDLQVEYVQSFTDQNGTLEKLGNFISIGDRIAMIEQLNLPEEKALEKKAMEALNTGLEASRYILAVISSNNLPVVKLSCLIIEWKRLIIDQNGALIHPTKPNAVKFETFVFDALPMARNPLIFEADRRKFSPIKNMTGIDSLKVRNPIKSNGLKDGFLISTYHAWVLDYWNMPFLLPVEIDIQNADLNHIDWNSVKFT